MKVIKMENAEPGKNSDVCKTVEYDFKDKDIDIGVATITGRFPDKNYCMNTICKELIYVLEGNGSLCFENEKIDYKKGDAILIEPYDKYYWDTEYSVVSMSCTPAWSMDQHKLVE